MSYRRLNVAKRKFNNIQPLPRIIGDIINNRVSVIADSLGQLPTTLSTSNKDRRTPLHLAASLGRTKIVELFLNFEFYSVNCRDNDLVTPLHRACRNDHSEVVSILLAHKADVDARSRHHITALHICCAFDSFKCASLIIDKVSNINATDSNGVTALHYAVYRNNIELIKLLLKHNAQPDVQDKNGQRPIHYAAIAQSTQAIQILIEAGCDVNARNKYLFTPLHFVAANGSEATFFELLKYCPNLEAQDIRGNMPIHVAAYNGKEILFEEISKNVDKNIPNPDGVTPLHFACASKYGYSLSLKIMEKVTDLNIVDKFGWTPLHYAASNGNDLTVKELLVRGANCNHCDSDLETPLHKSIQKCHTMTSDILIRNGAQLDISNKDGFTPLHFSVMAGLPWSCEWLIKAGANPLLWDKMGRTPHYLAVYYGIWDSFQWLMTSPYYNRLIEDSDQCYGNIVFPKLDAFKRSLLHYAAASNTCAHEFYELLFDCGEIDIIKCEQIEPKVKRAFLLACSKLEINQQDIYGRTPLHYICFRQCQHTNEGDIIQWIDKMVEVGADCSILDEDHALPLHYAIANGFSKTVVQRLLKLEMVKSVENYRKYFSIHCPFKIACFYDNSSALEFWAPYLGFESFSMFSKIWERAIEIATRRSHWNCVLILKSVGELHENEEFFSRMALLCVLNNNINGLRIYLKFNIITNFDVLMFAAATKSYGPEFLDEFFQRGANLLIKDSKNRNLLFYAVVADMSKVVTYLVESNVPLVTDCNGKNIFHLIASTGNLKMMELFFTFAIDKDFIQEMCSLLMSKDNDGFSPIQIACVKSHQNILEFFLTNFEQDIELTLMHFSGFTSNFKFVQYLLEKYGPSYIHSLGNDNRNLLHYACMSRRPNLLLLKLLIEELKFDVNVMDDNDLTPLLCAASVGNTSTVKYLLENTDSNLRCTDMKGNMSLHLACLSGSSSCALYIMKHAEEHSFLDDLISAENHYKQKPIHLAAKKGLKSVVVELVSNGASVLDQDSYGITPSMYCARDADAAYCIQIINALMELDLAETRQTNELEQTNSQSEVDNTTYENITTSGSSLRCSSQDKFESIHSRIRKSFHGFDSMIESRIQKLGRNSLPPKSCDTSLIRNVFKVNQTSQLNVNTSQNDNGTKNEDSEIEDTLNESNGLDESVYFQSDILVDSDSEMF